MNSVQQTKLNKQRPIGLFLLGTFLGITSVISCSNSSTYQNKYVDVVLDGDTFRDSKGYSYRLFGVDTPEIEDETFTEYMFPIRQYWAVLAKNRVKELIEEKTVEIEKITKDIYDRQISKWVIDNTDIGIQLISDGLAIVKYISANEKDLYHTYDYDYYNALLIAQKNAFDNNKGIWALGTAEFKELYD